MEMDAMLDIELRRSELPNATVQLLDLEAYASMHCRQHETQETWRKSRGAIKGHETCAKTVLHVLESQQGMPALYLPWRGGSRSMRLRREWR